MIHNIYYNADPLYKTMKAVLFFCFLIIICSADRKDGICDVKRNIKIEYRVVNVSRLVPGTYYPKNMSQSIEVFENVCCKGYIHEEQTNTCRCLCKNGNCTESGCLCYEGFELNPYDKSECLPVCYKSCTNGYCSAPNVCTCRYGFEPSGKTNDQCWPKCQDGFKRNDSDICVPICRRRCINADCTEPNVCTCWKNFVKSKTSQFRCEHRSQPPINCYKVCINSMCTGINECTCHKGYVKKDMFRCEPTCEGDDCGCTKCINGFCNHRGQCKCNNGFIKSQNQSVCIPVCKDACTNGYCHSPDRCKCFPGYDESTGRCSPVCKERCINSICDEPDHCECYRGFKHNSKYQCEPHCSGGCLNGHCVAPEICLCPAGYATTENGCTNVSDLLKCNSTQNCAEDPDSRTYLSTFISTICLAVICLILILILIIIKTRKRSEKRIERNSSSWVFMTEVKGFGNVTYVENPIFRPHDDSSVEAVSITDEEDIADCESNDFFSNPSFDQSNLAEENVFINPIYNNKTSSNSRPIYVNEFAFEYQSSETNDYMTLN